MINETVLKHCSSKCQKPNFRCYYVMFLNLHSWCTCIWRMQILCLLGHTRIRAPYLQVNIMNIYFPRNNTNGTTDLFLETSQVNKRKLLASNSSSNKRGKEGKNLIPTGTSKVKNLFTKLLSAISSMQQFLRWENSHNIISEMTHCD